MKLLFISFVILCVWFAFGNAVYLPAVGEGRISNPAVAYQGFLPFVASVHNGTVFLCAGVIISVNWILTSADCVERFTPTIDELKVKVGGVKHGPLEPGRVEILVNKVNLHPSFIVGNIADNIALLHLERNMVFNDYIQPASLAIPAKPIDMSQPAMVAGWGSSGSSIGGSSVAILQYNFNFEMMALSTCQGLIGLGPPGIPNALCTDHRMPHPYAESMDVGGPLLQFDSVLGMVLYGIVSFATGATLPTVYESIVGHRPWIYTVTGV